MPADLYRDAHLGIRSHLEELEARIREVEAELTDAFWASLDRDLRERLEHMRASISRRTRDSTDAFEDLAKAEGELAAYHEALARLVERLPLLEEAWLEVPEDAPDPPPQESRWSYHGYVDDDEAQAFTRACVSCVRDRDRDAELFWSSRTSCLARFSDQGTPFSLRVTASPQNGQVGEVAMWLVTSVARATPQLVIRPESLLSAFSKAIGFRHEQEVGDPSFDGLFLIEGTARAVDRLLTPTVRNALLALARYDVPTLEVAPERRIAQIRWDFEPTPKALDAAVRVLAAIRDTRPVAVPFRK